MASTREQAVEVLNSAKLAGDGNAKVDHLRGLLELVVRKEPALLPEFMPELLELQVDPSPAVKRFLAEFVDAAAAASPTPLVLQHSLACLRGLLADGAAASAKRALQSCYTTFRAAYTLVALRGSSGDTQPLQALWTEALALKAAVAAVAAAPGNDAVRMAATRFLEQVVLLLTAELVPAVAGVSAAAAPLAPGNAVTSKAALVRDADAALAQLVALLRQGVGEGGLSLPLASTAIRAAGGVAQQRPQFMGRLLPPLLTLANSAAFAALVPADGQAGVTAAAAAAAAGSSGGPRSGAADALRNALSALARSSHPSGQPWKKKLGAALEAMGVQDASPDADRTGKRPRQEPSSGPSKRPKLEQQQQQQQQSQQPPHLAPPQQQLAPAAGSAAPPLTPRDQLAKVLTVLQALVASQNAGVLAGVVGNLQPAVLADVVMEYMQQLPLRHTLLPDAAPLPPWIDTLLQLIAAQAPAGMAQGAAPVQQQEQPQPQPMQRMQPMAAAPAANGRPASVPQDVQQQQASKPQQQQQQQQQQRQAAAPMSAGMREAALLPPKASVPRQMPAVPSFKLEPLPLTQGQQLELRLGAVLRILHTDKTSRQRLRTALVAKLAADADSSMVPAVMQHLVQGVVSVSGASSGSGTAASEGDVGASLEVLLLWLNLLFARECQSAEPLQEPSSPTQAQPVGSGSDNGGAAAAGAQQQAGPSKAVLSSSSGRRLLTTGREVGSLYQHTLMRLLEGLRAALLPSSRVLVRVLLEVPALPMPAVRDFLQRAVECGPEWCTLALLAARDVILLRPPSRPALLQLVLDACCSPVSDTRGKAVRLVANRLFPDPGMAPTIELAARQRLDAMLPPQTLAAPVAAAAAAAAAAVPATEAVGEVAAAELAVEAPTEDAGVSARDAAVPKAEAAADTSAREEQQQPEPEAEPEEGQAGQDEQVQQEGQQEQDGVAAGSVATSLTGPDDAQAAQLCALYCALCTKKHSLLRHLFEVYGLTSDGGRAAIQRNAGGLAKTLGAGAPALLAVIQDPPAGSLPLVLQMLHVLTESAVPPKLMVTACLQLFNSSNDARALVPALRGMDRAAALRLLPALLTLQPEQLRPALERLVAPLPAAGDNGEPGGGTAAAPAVVSPEELLSAVHTLDHSRDSGLLRRMMQGVTVCISSPALFPPESLAACISQLLTRVPLPQLFMRTVIQTVAAAPRLRTFVVGVLRQLATKQIWNDATQWKGWLMCAQQTVPDSFPALVSLPADVLGTAAKAMPETTKQQMLQFVRQGSVTVPSAITAVLEAVQTQAA